MNRLAVALILSLTLPGVARAQSSSSDEARKIEEARQHVAKAKVHYDLGEYEQAAEEYIIVYRLKPVPAILFNVAQAYRQAGRYDKARQFYKSYLREAPTAANKAQIEQNIREMDDLIAKEKRAKEAAPVGVKEPAETTLPLQQQQAKMTEAQKAAEAQKLADAVSGQGAAAAPSAKMAKKADPAPATASQPEPPKVAMAATTPPKTSAPPAATGSTPAPVQQQTSAEEGGGSIFSKWWFWTAAGVVVVGAGAAAMTMGGNSAPASHFPTTPVFP